MDTEIYHNLGTCVRGGREKLAATRAQIPELLSKSDPLTPAGRACAGTANHQSAAVQQMPDREYS